MQQLSDSPNRRDVHPAQMLDNIYEHAQDFTDDTGQTGSAPKYTAGITEDDKRRQERSYNGSSSPNRSYKQDSIERMSQKQLSEKALIANIDTILTDRPAYPQLNKKNSSKKGLLSNVDSVTYINNQQATNQYLPERNVVQRRSPNGYNSKGFLGQGRTSPNSSIFDPNNSRFNSMRRSSMKDSQTRNMKLKNRKGSSPRPWVFHPYTQRPAKPKRKVSLPKIDSIKRLPINEFYFADPFTINHKTHYNFPKTTKNGNGGVGGGVQQKNNQDLLNTGVIGKQNNNYNTPARRRPPGQLEPLNVDLNKTQVNKNMMSPIGNQQTIQRNQASNRTLLQNQQQYTGMKSQSSLHDSNGNDNSQSPQRQKNTREQKRNFQRVEQEVLKRINSKGSSVEQNEQYGINSPNGISQITPTKQSIKAQSTIKLNKVASNRNSRQNSKQSSQQSIQRQSTKGQQQTIRQSTTKSGGNSKNVSPQHSSNSSSSEKEVQQNNGGQRSSKQIIRNSSLESFGADQQKSQNDPTNNQSKSKKKLKEVVQQSIDQSKQNKKSKNSSPQVFQNSSLGEASPDQQPSSQKLLQVIGSAGAGQSERLEGGTAHFKSEKQSDALRNSGMMRETVEDVLNNNQLIESLQNHSNEIGSLRTDSRDDNEPRITKLQKNTDGTTTPILQDKMAKHLKHQITSRIQDNGQEQGPIKVQENQYRKSKTNKSPGNSSHLNQDLNYQQVQEDSNEESRKSIERNKYRQNKSKTSTYDNEKSQRSILIESIKDKIEQAFDDQLQPRQSINRATNQSNYQQQHTDDYQEQRHSNNYSPNQPNYQERNYQNESDPIYQNDINNTDLNQQDQQHWYQNEQLGNNNHQQQRHSNNNSPNQSNYQRNEEDRPSALELYPTQLQESEAQNKTWYEGKDMPLKKTKSSTSTKSKNKDGSSLKDSKMSKLGSAMKKKVSVKKGEIDEDKNAAKSPKSGGSKLRENLKSALKAKVKGKGKKGKGKSKSKSKSPAKSNKSKSPLSNYKSGTESELQAHLQATQQTMNKLKDTSKTIEDIIRSSPLGTRPASKNNDTINDDINQMMTTMPHSVLDTTQRLLINDQGIPYQSLTPLGHQLAGGQSMFNNMVGNRSVAASSVQGFYPKMTTLKGDQIDISTFMLKMSSNEDEDITLNMSDHMRSAEQFKSIESRKYPGGMAIELQTNLKPVHQQLKENKDLLMWNLHTQKSTTKTTSDQLHLQFMEQESDLEKSKKGLCQNHITGCQSLINEYQAKFVKKPEGYYESLNGKPILYNQVLFVTSLSQNFKAYTSKQRFYSIMKDNQNSVVSQKQMQQLKPRMNPNVDDIQQKCQEIILHLAQLAKFRNEKDGPDKEFQIIILQFMVNADNKAFLAKVHPGMPNLPKFMSDDTFTALLFKIDKKVREAHKMSPNPLVNTKSLFKSFWKKISYSNEERTEKALVSGGPGFAESQFMESASIALYGQPNMMQPQLRQQNLSALESQQYRDQTTMLMNYRNQSGFAQMENPLNDYNQQQMSFLQGQSMMSGGDFSQGLNARMTMMPQVDFSILQPAEKFKFSPQQVIEKKQIVYNFCRMALHRYRFLKHQGKWDPKQFKNSKKGSVCREGNAGVPVTANGKNTRRTTAEGSTMARPDEINQTIFEATNASIAERNAYIQNRQGKHDQVPQPITDVTTTPANQEVSIVEETNVQLNTQVNKNVDLDQSQNQTKIESKQDEDKEKSQGNELIQEKQKEEGKGADEVQSQATEDEKEFTKMRSQKMALSRLKQSQVSELESNLEEGKSSIEKQNQETSVAPVINQSLNEPDAQLQESADANPLLNQSLNQATNPNSLQSSKQDLSHLRQPLPSVLEEQAEAELRKSQINQIAAAPLANHLKPQNQSNPQNPQNLQQLSQVQQSTQNQPNQQATQNQNSVQSRNNSRFTIRTEVPQTNGQESRQPIRMSEQRADGSSNIAPSQFNAPNILPADSVDITRNGRNSNLFERRKRSIQPIQESQGSHRLELPNINQPLKHKDWFLRSLHHRASSVAASGMIPSLPQSKR